MPPIYKVAVIQLYSKPLDVADNFSRAAEFIRSAAAQGAVLAVLPEYHLTGWEPDRPGFMDACQLWENYLARYRQMAKALKICIVPGTLVEPRKDEATGELALFNVAYFIDDQGGILGSYIKKNIWHSERAHLSSGRQRHEAIDTPIGKVGMLICWDIAFPEAFRELITQGAKIIIVPCFWGLTDCSEEGLRYNPGSAALVMDSTLTTRAFENTCAIVFANTGGPPGSGFAGLSQVTVPFIGPLARFGSCSEGMLVVDLDMRLIDAAEEHYKVRDDLARSDWHYDYRGSVVTKAEEEAINKQ